jgi:hypothetical protein
MLCTVPSEVQTESSIFKRSARISAKRSWSGEAPQKYQT